MRLRVCDAGTVDARGGSYERQQGGRSKAGGAMYGLGMFGALVYCWQQADSFWEYRLSIFQGIFWLLLCSTRCLKPLTD
jgi:hypothetical protein